MTATNIHIDAKINAPLEQVWKAYNDPFAIQQWNQASQDWHCPSSENDLRVGGKFKNTMAAKDGSFSFDFEGIYSEVIPLQTIAYSIADGRTVKIIFEEKDETTNISIDFLAESVNPIDMQKQGWLAILNSFKNYVEHL